MAEKVTIIVPVYNTEKYLHRCVQSILNQSYKNWEAIFVNDGSTDSSLSILQEYAKKDDRIRIIDKKNGGPSSARNAGLDALQTDFFAFADSDDSINPNFLKKTLEAALSYNCDLVVTDYNFQGKACGLYFSGLVKMNPSQYVKCIFGGPIAKLYKRKIINSFEKKLRFHEDMKFVEDYVFTTSYATKIDNFYAISEPMYNYHYDAEDSLVHRYGRNELPFEQYIYCLEAPWRILQGILNDSSVKQPLHFSQWAYALYNELWKLLFFNQRHFINKDAQKKLSTHFRLRHKDFVPHVALWKRLTAPQRYPRLTKILKFIWRTSKRIFKH